LLNIYGKLKNYFNVKKKLLASSERVFGSQSNRISTLSQYYTEKQLYAQWSLHLARPKHSMLLHNPVANVSNHHSIHGKKEHSDVTAIFG
jgi:hypothetical protein